MDLQKLGFRRPLLVLGMDGVGTKLELASRAGLLQHLGADLVGMCVNDVVCHGAAPVAFLDYYVTGRLERGAARTVIASVARACAECGCALVGGETAEMPGVYRPEQWDLAGVCVGVKEDDGRPLPALSEWVLPNPLAPCCVLQDARGRPGAGP